MTAQTQTFARAVAVKMLAGLTLAVVLPSVQPHSIFHVVSVSEGTEETPELVAKNVRHHHTKEKHV